MNKQDYTFSGKTVSCYFHADFSLLEKLVDKSNTIIITDENIASLHENKFDGWKTIIVKPGEENKQQFSIDYIIEHLIQLKADRETFIIGAGGGVVTDVAGYAASIYMRGLKFGFVPTSILGMVDAAIGGKNGIDIGVYKNLVGTINQPKFLLYDYSFLETLNKEEWTNGFAEIIKHACIKDETLFKYLENNSLEVFSESVEKTGELIERNVKIKCTVVANDEFEKGERRLLNFGHTIGHAVENIYKLPHGNAVSIGIAGACTISEELNNFNAVDKKRVLDILKKYHLPVNIDFDKDRVWEVLLMDKKKSGDNINFILLNKIGEAIIKSIPLNQLKELFNHII